jgi:WD40 repeat protein
VVSSGADGTIRQWEVQTGTCLATMKPLRPYEGIDITGATGLNKAQKSALMALGAIAEES